jgi:hypothetical protein
VILVKINPFFDNEPRQNNGVLVDQYIETLPNGSTYSIIDYYSGFFYDNTDEITVPESHYFFLGDNRDNSQDSRTTALGFVHEDFLIGKVKRVLISSEFSLFNVLKYHKIRLNRFLLNPYMSEGSDSIVINTNTSSLNQQQKQLTTVDKTDNTNQDPQGGNKTQNQKQENDFEIDGVLDSIKTNN